MLSGWTPTEIHTPEYDSEGRVTRIVVTRDSEWDDEQVAVLIAEGDAAGEIGPHGHPMDEAMSPLADPFRRAPGGWTYRARLRKDFAAAAAADARAERAKKYPDADLSSDVWTVEKHWND